MARKPLADLTILEGKWFPGQHVSVHDIYVQLLRLSCGEGFQHYYEPFTTESSFNSAVQHAMKKNKADTITIACHGTESVLQGYHDTGIDCQFVIDSFNTIKGTKKKGLFIGACKFGNQKNIEKILTECPRIEWIAGYNKSPEWTNSAILETYFLRSYFRPDWRSMPGTKKRASDRLQYAAEQVKKNMHGLAVKCGFQVYLKDQKSIQKLI